MSILAMPNEQHQEKVIVELLKTRVNQSPELKQLIRAEIELINQKLAITEIEQ